jgi:prephenate dehydrogenase
MDAAARRAPGACLARPHLVAYALVDAVATSGRTARRAGPRRQRLLRDTTRIAGSAPELWRDILLANAPAVRAALGEFRRSLAAMEAAIAAGDAAALDAALERARAARGALGGAS